MFKVGVAGISQEYNSKIKHYVAPNITTNAFQKNMDKNRYKDVLCIDQTRVVLEGGNDYIHANYVRGPPLTNTFICTQVSDPIVYIKFDFLCCPFRII
ncbi:hypothetical protein AB6A40_003326 [Gnathostoma spinigerum]|uniref:Tyrosine-protein phosphatase domain-containing protein n=1 Tax=Gnathostoma spinigerum TaxID=75299 RepID=A0ABD6EBJ3_9BILA